MSALILGTIACAAWCYLIVARGGFWRVRLRDVDIGMSPGEYVAPRVVAIVPARDEAEVIGGCIRSLLQQDYRGEFSVIVVDDDSDDATVAEAWRAAGECGAAHRLAVVKASPRGAGWTGKLWAIECGARHLRDIGAAPDYLLFTDADIVHESNSVTNLVRQARRDGLRLVSRMAKLRCQTFHERAFVPAFVFFFQMLYPFAWVNRPGRRTAAAAGGCMLVHREALERAGGIAAIRGALIDDCALARLLKVRGPISLALTERVRSVRAYRSLRDIRHMIVRTAYAQLDYSPLLLALAVAAMTVTYVAPLGLALFGIGLPRILGLVAWVQMALAFQPTVRFYRVCPLWGFALPAVATCYIAFTLDSALQSARGRGGLWKGRIYPAGRA